MTLNEKIVIASTLISSLSALVAFFSFLKTKSFQKSIIGHNEKTRKLESAKDIIKSLDESHLALIDFLKNFPPAQDSNDSDEKKICREKVITYGDRIISDYDRAEEIFDNKEKLKNHLRDINIVISDMTFEDKKDKVFYEFYKLRSKIDEARKIINSALT